MLPPLVVHQPTQPNQLTDATAEQIEPPASRPPPGGSRERPGGPGAGNGRADPQGDGERWYLRPSLRWLRQVRFDSRPSILLAIFYFNACILLFLVHTVFSPTFRPNGRNEPLVLVAVVLLRHFFVVAAAVVVVTARQREGYRR